MDLTNLKNTIGHLDPDIPGEGQWITAMDMLASAKAKLKEIDEDFKERFVQRLDSQGDLTCGENRWYVGTTTTHKCNDEGQTLLAVFDATGGDLDAVCGVLASGAIKPGAANKILGERFPEHFTTTVKRDPKTGKPTREPKKARPE